MLGAGRQGSAGTRAGGDTNRSSSVGSLVVGGRVAGLDPRNPTPAPNSEPDKKRTCRQIPSLQHASMSDPSSGLRAASVHWAVRSTWSCDTWLLCLAEEMHTSVAAEVTAPPPLAGPGMIPVESRGSSRFAVCALGRARRHLGRGGRFDCQALCSTRRGFCVGDVRGGHYCEDACGDEMCRPPTCSWLGLACRKRAMVGRCWPARRLVHAGAQGGDSDRTRPQH